MPVIQRNIFIFSSVFIFFLLAFSSKEFSPEFSGDFHGDSSKEIVLFTMPKTGTHLLRPLLEHLTQKQSTSYWSKEIDFPKKYFYDKNMTDLLLMLPNVVQAYWLHQPIPKNTFVHILDSLLYDDEFFVTHAAYSEEMEKIIAERRGVIFFLVRDPRDWVISVIKHPPASGLDIYGGMSNPIFASLDLHEKIDYIIDGTPDYYSVSETYARFLPWMNSPNCCPIRFEALLGPRGGVKSAEEQLVELRKISRALKIDIPDEDLLKAFDESFGTGIVFSKGKAGSWKEFFTEDQKVRSKELFGDLLIKLGYENDYNW